MKKHRFREWLSLRSAKNPRGTILLAILIMNVVFFMLAAVVISNLAPESLAQHGFWASIFYTVSMILDAGCISYVVTDIGAASVGVIIACLVIVLVGSITFTGAVIGYVTNYISEFIDRSTSGERKLRISHHTVILNWNNRSSEIINDLLYSEEKETVVILVPEGRKRIENEINERISATIYAENERVREMAKLRAPFIRWFYYRFHRFKNNVTFLIYEGDTFSTQKLNDVSIMKAKSIIIMSEEIKGSAACRYDYEERMQKLERGNSNTVKTLIQVSEMTGQAESLDNQKIVVEVGDEWTDQLVNRIIAHKSVEGKCVIVPVKINQILGQILSQFSIMPELNTVYSELFSNRGAQFFARHMTETYTDDFHVHTVFNEDLTCIPLCSMEEGGKKHFYYLADSEKDVNERVAPSERTLNSTYKVELKKNYWLEKRNIVILGHNSKSRDVMAGFDAFRSEWNFNTPELIAENGSEEILDIVVIDDAKSLDKLHHYKNYPEVSKVVEADVFDREIITQTINEVVDKAENDVSILILSDDMVDDAEVDSSALTYLIYVRDIIAERSKEKNFDPGKIDVVVEIMNPKNYDIVRSYSINNIIISNRYISKMITQIGEKEAIYHFYNDILTYDETNTNFESKELYAKKVSRFFEKIPGACNASELIRAVYEASPEENRTIVIGYCHKDGEMTLFSGNQERIPVLLDKTDKLIMFTNH